MNKLTVETEYDRAAFADRLQTLCKVSVKREDGSLLWEHHYEQLLFSSPLQVIAVAVGDLAAQLKTVSASPANRIDQ